MPYPLCERIINRMRGEIFRQEHPGYMLPQYLEPTNICNLHCPDCPIDSLKQERGFMSLETVDKVIEVMRPGKPLHLYLMGEPLLHREIDEIVRRTSTNRKNIYTLLSTNGTLLTDDLIDSFFRSELKALVVSLHTKKSVDAFYRAAQFLEGKEYPTLEGRHILTNKAVPQWLDDMGVEDKYRKLISKCTPHGFAGNVEAKRKDLTETQVRAKRRSCKILKWNVVAIRWNGLVNPCPYDDANTETLGHIDNFKDIRPMRCYELCRHCDDTAYTVQV